MSWKRSVLVVANVTATSPELLDELIARSRREPASFTLIVPATPFGGGREVAGETLAAALDQLRQAGLDAHGEVGAPDPVVAVTDAWDPKRYDEIIVSTLPIRVSKWLHTGLPERIAKLTGATISHVVAQPPRPEVATGPPPEHGDLALGPLSVLRWGAHPPQ